LPDDGVSFQGHEKN